MGRKTGPARSTVALVWRRDRYRCRRCGAPGTNVHHRRPRGLGGTRDESINSPANLVLLCGSGTTGCHGWIESHRAEARAEGWLVSQWADPAVIPINTRHGLLWLNDNGKTEPEGEMEWLSL